MLNQAVKPPAVNQVPANSCLDRLLLQASRTRMYLDSPEGEAYRKYLRERLDECSRMIARERDSVEVYRLQGEYRVLECLNTLPLVVDDYLKGVSKGTFNKIVDPLQFNPRKELENVR